VGVVLNLALYFGRAVAFKVSGAWQPDWFALAWIGISIVALYRYKQNMILWIGVSALAGLIYLSF
jgi:chromate transporter